jgi:hypothetical protein
VVCPYLQRSETAFKATTRHYRPNNGKDDANGGWQTLRVRRG